MTVQRYAREKCDRKEAGFCLDGVCDTEWLDKNGNILGRVVYTPLCLKVGWGKCPDGQDRLDPESIL